MGSLAWVPGEDDGRRSVLVPSMKSVPFAASARTVFGGVVLSLVLVTGGAVHVPSHPEHAPPPWITDVVTRSEPGSARAYTMRLVVAVDEEFVHARGDSWESDARSVVLTASDLMGQIDISLVVTLVARWDSNPGRLPEMVDDVVSQVGLPPDAVLVALTSQTSMEPPVYDGWASSSRPVIVIKVTEPERTTLPALLAHELGHILGLDEHGPDHPDDDEGCLMVGRGYQYGDRWCPEDERAVALLLATIL